MNVFVKMKNVVSAAASAYMESAGGSKYKRILSYLTTTSLSIPIIGSSLLILGWCSAGCTDTQGYKLFGLSFPVFGLIFFSILLFISFGRNYRLPRYRHLYDLLLTGTLGAEYLFISLQKNFIGHYCPVCLVIAVAVGLSGGLRIAEVITYKWWFPSRPGQGIKLIYDNGIRALIIISLLFFTASSGVLAAAVGVEPPRPVNISSIKIDSMDLWMGKADSKVDVVFVSDWFCPYCKNLEPIIEKILPALGSSARYTFVDDPIHDKSFKFLHINLSLLLNSKEKYMDGRKAIYDLIENKTPLGKDNIAKTMLEHGIKYSPGNNEILVKAAVAGKNFLIDNRINFTPTVVIRNRATGKSKTLYGVKEITETSLLENLALISAPK